MGEKEIFSLLETMLSFLVFLFALQVHLSIKRELLYL